MSRESTSPNGRGVKGAIATAPLSGEPRGWWPLWPEEGPPASEEPAERRNLIARSNSASYFPLAVTDLVHLGFLSKVEFVLSSRAIVPFPASPSLLKSRDWWYTYRKVVWTCINRHGRGERCVVKYRTLERAGNLKLNFLIGIFKLTYMSTAS